MRTISVTSQDLDKRITVKKPVTVQDSLGQPVATMVSQGTFWGKKTDLRLVTSRKEQVIAGEKRAIGQTTILLRLNRVTVLMNETWCVVCQGVTLSIIGKVVLDNRWIELTCIEGYYGG